MSPPRKFFFAGRFSIHRSTNPPSFFWDGVSLLSTITRPEVAMPSFSLATWALCTETTLGAPPCRMVRDSRWALQVVANLLLTHPFCWCSLSLAHDTSSAINAYMYIYIYMCIYICIIYQFADIHCLCC